MKVSPNQSITRGLQVLQAVAASPEGLSVQEMADLLQVSRPTAHNIATTLLNEAFLIKHSKPVRYRVGPAPERIAARAHYHERQLKAKDLMLGYSKQHPGSGWVYAEAGADEMRIIWRLDFKRPEVIERVDREVSHPYDAATALIFHAFADEPRAEAMRRRFPFAEFGRSIFENRAEFNACLKDIRKNGCVSKPWFSRRELGAIAAPIFNQDNSLTGSIGAFFPIEHQASFAVPLLKTTKECALRLKAV